MCFKHPWVPSSTCATRFKPPKNNKEESRWRNIYVRWRYVARRVLFGWICIVWWPEMNQHYLYMNIHSKHHVWCKHKPGRKGRYYIESGCNRRALHQGYHDICSPYRSWGLLYWAMAIAHIPTIFYHNIRTCTSQNNARIHK